MSRLLRLDIAAPPHPLFDVHVHVGSSDSAELYYPHLTSDEWLELADAAGVARSCVFPPLNTSYRSANESLADLAATSDGGVLALARLGGRRIPWTTHQLWQLRRKLRNRFAPRPPDVDDLSRFAGVKLLPHLDGIPDEDVFAEIDRLGLPVLVHGGIHVRAGWIEEQILPRTSGPVIIAHLGAFPAGDPELRQALEVAARQERVYLDTSGVWLAAFLRHAAEAVPDKLLFGSDAPLTHPLVAWHHLRAAVMDDALLEQVGWTLPCEVFDVPQVVPSRRAAPGDDGGDAPGDG